MGRDATSTRSGRLAGLDGLRGIAAVAVAILHVTFYTNHPKPLESVGDALVQALRLGVPLFFVLSGLLLYLPWVRATGGTRPAPRVKDYALRRSARILPAYYLALIGSTIFLLPAHDSHIPSVSQALALGALVQNWWPDAAQKLNPPAWTLAVETSFYIVLPLLGWVTLRWLRTTRKQLAGCALIVLISLVANALVAVIGQGGWHRTLPGTAYAFALGMAAAVLLPHTTRGLASGRRAALAITGVVLVLADAFAHEPARLPGYLIWQDIPAAAGFAMIVFAVASGAANRLLAARPLRWLGERSYGLYLWHYPVILLFVDRHALPHQTLAASVLVIGTALAFASLSWQYVEQPIIRRARALTGRDDSAPAHRRRSAGRRRSAHASRPARARLARSES